MNAYTATGLATQFHIPLGQDFCTLRASEVERVLDAADLVKYRRPKNANGSRGRYFYAALTRAVNRASNCKA
jgi:hypothetical protein